MDYQLFDGYLIHFRNCLEDFMRYKTKSAFIATHPLLLIIDFSPHFVVQSRWVTFFDGNDKLEESILN